MQETRRTLFRIDLGLKKLIGSQQVPPIEVLQEDGPRVAVTIGLHAKIEAHRKANNIHIPPPITGIALVDTGATVTTLHMSVALALGLAPIDAVSSEGIGGEAQGFSSSCGVQIRTERVSLMGVHCLDVPSLINSGLIALIGRDILRDLLLVYDGPAGLSYLERYETIRSEGLPYKKRPPKEHRRRR